MKAWWRHQHRARRLRRYLLAWTLGPIALFMAMDAASLYRSSLETTAAAHDRLLKATAQQMGDLLRVERNSLTIHVPLALIEALEGSGGSRMYWRVIGFDGREIAGDPELPLPPGDRLQRTAGLSYSYVADVARKPVQVTALHQPVETSQGQGVALILVGETQEAREATAAELLRDVLLRQLLVMALIAGVVWLVVRRALQPLDSLRAELKQRDARDPAPLLTQGQEELQPVIDEMNLLIARQQELLHQQRRFVADASHQLRTPLTVLKTQLQSGIAGDVPPPEVLPAMLRTVDRINHLANQLLTKMRLEEAAQPAVGMLHLDEIAREAVLELSPLIAAGALQFSLEGPGVRVHGSAWMAGELVRNLLANAIRHCPPGGALGIRFESDPQAQRMVVWDSGPGIPPPMREWLFQPFASAQGVAGAGLGLAICLDIARAMGAGIELVNREDAGRTAGLDAVVSWPAA